MDKMDQTTPLCHKFSVILCDGVTESFLVSVLVTFVMDFSLICFYLFAFLQPLVFGAMLHRDEAFEAINCQYTKIASSISSNET